MFGWVAAKAAIVFPRDHVSEFAVRTHVAHLRSILLPDSAFALKFPAAAVNELFERRGLDAGARTLALVISSALRPDESGDAHVSLFSHIATDSSNQVWLTQVVIVVQHDEDRPISRQLAQNLGLDLRCVIDDDLDPASCRACTAPVEWSCRVDCTPSSWRCSPVQLRYRSLPRSHSRNTRFSTCWASLHSAFLRGWDPLMPPGCVLRLRANWIGIATPWWPPLPPPRSNWQTSRIVFARS